MLSLGGLLLLAGAAILAMPGPGWAGHGGGGHFGGGHFGGAHFGGAHFGGGHFGVAHFGGFHGGLYHGGYRFGYPHAFNRPYYGYRHYGYYPYYGLYGYYPYYDAYGYTGSGLGYNSSYYSSGGGEEPPLVDDYPSVTTPAASYPSYYPAATAESDEKAHITANVPADARLWFDGTLTKSTGPVREFSSPLLTPGRQYTYEVRATWNEDGHEVTQAKKLAVTAGANITLDFPLPA
jgi:uncharacterized protein (TIGR03000 family)